MPPILDVFRNDAFSMISLTDAINKIPFVPRQVGRLGIFEERRVATTTVSLEERNGVLTLLPTKQRGQAGSLLAPVKRTQRALKVPHVPHNDNIKADEIQNVREFGTMDQLQSMQTVVNQRLRDMAANHDATLEHLMLGAVKGTVVDSDGSTVIHNLFTEFGVSQHTEIDFDLDNATPAAGALRKKCHDVWRKIQDALLNVPFTGVHAFCSPQFFDDLVSHPEVTQAYERWMSGELLRTGLARRGFEIFGITFEEYRGEVNAVKFVADDKAHFFPVGAPGVYQIYYAPADYMETVNTLGLPRYAKISPDERFQKFVEVETQSNPLVLCTYPRALIQGKRT